MPDFSDVFADCLTHQAVDAAFKAAYHTTSLVHDRHDLDDLQEAARRAHVRIVENREKPGAATKSGSDRLNRNTVRSWAKYNGVVLGIGDRVTIAVENQYREAHDMALLERKQRASRLEVTETTGVSSREVRAWARDNGIDVGARGRVHPDVIAKYQEAHS